MKYGCFGVHIIAIRRYKNMKAEKNTSKLLKGAGLAVGGLLVGSLAFGLGFGLQAPEVVEVEKQVNVTVADPAVLAENLELSADLAAVQAELEAHADAIKEDAEDAAFEVLAEDELDSRSFLRYVHSELGDLGFDVEDKEHISFELIEEWEVTADESDREDGDAILRSELRVRAFENDDKDEKVREYFDVKVTIKEGEVDGVILTPQ